MGASSANEDYYYDLLSRLLEEGQGQHATPPPATVSPPPPPPAAAPGPPRRRGRIPAWARAVWGFSIATCVLIVVFLAAPLAVQYRNRDEAFICVFLVVMSAAFPITGYVFTAELSEET